MAFRILLTFLFSIFNKTILFMDKIVDLLFTDEFGKIRAVLHSPLVFYHCTLALFKNIASFPVLVIISTFVSPLWTCRLLVNVR